MDDAYAYCFDQVRRFDKDRFLASLFMPVEARRHVFAILAFSAEIARVRDVVSDPLPGEVRLQWWRDMLEGRARGAVEANPLAQALTDTIARFSLPRDALVRLIEARTFDLYDDPMPTLHDLEGYCGETASALVQISAIILSQGADPGAGTAEAAGHSGVAYALTGLMRALPFHAARGQVYMPADVLKRHGIGSADLLTGCTSEGLGEALAELRGVARQHLARTRALMPSLPAAVAPAFLPCTLVAPMLDQMERREYDPFRTVIDIAQWQKQLRFWWMARKARRLPRGS